MKKFKKAVCAILIFTLCIGICSCNPFGVNTDDYAISLAAEKQKTDYTDYTTEEYLAFNSKLQNFCARLSELLYREFGKDNENLCFSPVSVYMALALAIECSDGETRNQALNALGMSYDEVKGYTSKLYSLCNKEYYYNNLVGSKKVEAFSELNNSIWLDDSVKINKDSANALAKSYNTDIFNVNFGNGEADKVIKQYIKDKTHGLIDGDVRMDSETVFTILNTLYLKEIWLELGKELDKTSDKYDFKNTDGSTESTKLLMSKYLDGKAYGGENYESFYARTNNGYKLHFVLPNDGVSVSDVFTSKNISKILSLTDYGSVDDENKQIHYTRVFFPEFEAEFDKDIDPALKKMGIVNMFSPVKADFSALNYDYPYNLYCQKVVHKTALKVDARGIEGAAITAMLGAGAAGPPPYEKVYHDFIIDRAFGFVLTDSQGTVLFSGVVNTK